MVGRVLHGDNTLLCTLDRLFDRASVFVMKGASFRGAGWNILGGVFAYGNHEMNK